MNHRYSAQVEWRRGTAAFSDGKYSRAHRWSFDGGATVAASSSPLIVPTPQSDPAAVDPEEAFVAALASCHLLWFLSVARSAGYIVESYRDEAEGTMEKNAQGKLWVARVVLKPHVIFAGAQQPDVSRLRALHEKAHAECYLANSVKTQVLVEPVA